MLFWHFFTSVLSLNFIFTQGSINSLFSRAQDNNLFFLSSTRITGRGGQVSVPADPRAVRRLACQDPPPGSHHLIRKCTIIVFVMGWRCETEVGQPSWAVGIITCPNWSSYLLS